MHPRSLRWSWLVVLLTIGCHPYGDALQGEFNAGAADPFNFPPPYRASGGSFTREIGGSGSFTERRAFAHGAPANYFFFPFPPSLVSTTGYAAPAATAQPLRVAGPSSLSIPNAFEFDPAATPQDTASCKAPDGYAYDPFRDDVHYDRQGNLLTALPNATFGVGSLPTWSYVPIVAHVPVTSNGEACQSVKSDLTLLARRDVTVPVDTSVSPPAPKSDGLLAWAVIDPGSPVFRVGQTSANSTGVTAQRFGWYRQFLSAYIDGGPVPTAAGTTAGTTVMVTQKLYFPRSGAPTGGNGLGAGNDVVQFQRGEPGYSPVCQIFTYVLPASTPVPKDVATIEANPAAYNVLPNATNPGPVVTATGAIIPTYGFCLQAQ